MNASKTLIAAIAAATIVGTVGFVSAQTTDSAPPAAQSNEPMTSPSTTTQDMQQPAPATPAPESSTAPADMSSPSYVAPPADAQAPAAAPAAADPSTPSTMSEPAPKADRN
jgi:hypothetical protein